MIPQNTSFLPFPPLFYPSKLPVSPSRYTGLGMTLLSLIPFSPALLFFLFSLVIPKNLLGYVSLISGIRALLVSGFLSPICHRRFLTFNLFDFHVSELGCFYNLTDAFDHVNSCDSYSVKSIGWSKGVVKVVLLSDKSAAVVLSSNGLLGLLRLDTNSQRWEVIGDACEFRFNDIIEFKGNLLGVDPKGWLYEIGLDNTGKIDLIASFVGDALGDRYRVVESLGELYLVNNWRVTETNDAEFKVYQLLSSDVGTKKWEQVSEIGGMVFFFGDEFSLSVSTQELGGVYRKNCIVHKEFSFNRHNIRNNKWGLEPYVLRVCHLEDVSHVWTIRSYPSYTKLLWPPPSWFCPNVKSDEIYLLQNLVWSEDGYWKIDTDDKQHGMRRDIYDRLTFLFHGDFVWKDDIGYQQRRGLEPPLLGITAATDDCSLSLSLSLGLGNTGKRRRIRGF